MQCLRLQAYEFLNVDSPDVCICDPAKLQSFHDLAHTASLSCYMLLLGATVFRRLHPWFWQRSAHCCRPEGGRRLQDGSLLPRRAGPLAGGQPAGGGAVQLRLRRHPRRPAERRWGGRPAASRAAPAAEAVRTPACRRRCSARAGAPPVPARPQRPCAPSWCLAGSSCSRRRAGRASTRRRPTGRGMWSRCGS